MLMLMPEQTPGVLDLMEEQMLMIMPMLDQIDGVVMDLMDLTEEQVLMLVPMLMHGEEEEELMLMLMPDQKDQYGDHMEEELMLMLTQKLKLIVLEEKVLLKLMQKLEQTLGVDQFGEVEVPHLPVLKQMLEQMEVEPLHLLMLKLTPMDDHTHIT